MYLIPLLTVVPFIQWPAPPVKTSQLGPMTLTCDLWPCTSVTCCSFPGMFLVLVSAFFFFRIDLPVGVPGTVIYLNHRCSFSCRRPNGSSARAVHRLCSAPYSVCSGAGQRYGPSLVLRWCQMERLKPNSSYPRRGQSNKATDEPALAPADRQLSEADCKR